MFEKVTSTKNILLLALVALTTTTTHTHAQENNWRICEHQPDGTVFPLYGACNSYVYCVGGNPFSLPCPPFMGFSKTVLACVIYSNSDCVEQTTTTTSPPIYSSKEDPVTIATTLTTQGYCDNEQRHENQLACLGQVFGDLVPYPGSCTKFLVCICEYPVVSICPPGKWFDGKLKICNSPANVKCGDNQGTSVPSEEVTTPITFSTTESNDWGKDCTAPDGISPDICLNYDNGVLLNDPYNCSAYINCYMGCPIISYCEDYKVFNAVLKICDTNETVQCQELPMPRTTTTTTEASSSTSTQKSIFTTNEPSEENSTSLTTTPTDDCIAPLGMYADICANHAQDSFLAYPYNCTAFIICIWECPYLEYCENGKIFNDILGICDTPESMQCKELSHPTPGTPTSTLSTATSSSTTTELPFSTTLPPDVNPDLCWNQANYTTYPYATDCSKYLQCLNNKIRVHSCPNGWLFNSQLMLCDKTSEDFCYMAGTTSEKTLLRYATTEADDFDSCIGQLSGTTFPDIKNCSMYYLCMGNDSYYKLSCPTDNYYDIQIGHCGPEELVSPTGCLGEITTTASTVQPMRDRLITSTEPDLPSQGICGDYSNGELIPYPNNCQKYISCVRPIPVAFYCNNNWYFDVEQQKCILDSQGICSESPENTTTTIKPPTYICQNLLLGDWQLYPGDCRFYYECLGDGYFMLKMCIEGEYFDPLIGQCSSQVNEEYCMQNFDTTTQATTTAKPSGICDEQPLGSKVPYPDNCFKYIVCDAPIPEGFNCPLYLQFSLAQQACVEPIESDCGIITTPTTTTLGLPTMPYNQCSNKPEFTLLPYPKDCGMFIICIQELEHLAFCLKNQYFDALQGECIDGASEDACRVEETTTTSGDLTTLELSTTTDITTSMDYSTQDPTSTEATTTQDPDSTTSMDYSTQDQTSTEATTTQDPDSTTSLDYSTQDQTSTEATTTQDPDLGPCYGKPEGTKIPYPNNCTKYIECQDPLPLGHNCPVGLEFSVAFEECVIPELADCSTNTNPTTKPNTTTDTTDPTTEQNISTETSSTTTVNTEDSCESKPNGSTLTYPEDCSKYYVCINGKSKLTNCMLNAYYDPLSGECYADISPTACQESTTSLPTTTPSSEETCENKPNGFTLPYPEDCSKYYNCLNGYSILTKCMLNTYYDPLSGECYGDISPTACQLLTTTSSPTVPTTISQTTENIGTDTTEHVSTETSNTPTTQPTEIPITSETPITTTENASSETSESTSPTTTAEIITTTDSEETCENKPNGSTLPYPSDCSKYLTCINGNSKLTSCMPYTFFDPSSGMCDSDISPTACLEISTTIPTTISQTTESITTESTVTSESSIPTTENVTKETSGTTNIPTRATTEYISTETSITTNTPIITEASTDTTLDPATTSTEATTLSTLNPETTVTPDRLTSDPTPTADPTTTADPLTSDPTTLDPTTLHTSTTTISLTTENIGTDTTEHVSTETSNTPTTQTTENPITSETPITTSENVSTETSETTSPTTIAGIITTPDSEETCENKPNGSTLPYPSDCSKYYTCINGNSKLTTCMPYTYFDPSSGMCDSDISTTACLEISTTIATTISQTTESISTESTITSESSIPTTENVTKDTSEATNAPTKATTEYISTETSITTTTPITTIITEASTLSTLDPATTFTTETTTLSTLHPETTVTPDPTTQDPTTLNPTTPDPLTSDPATQDPTTLDPITLNTTTEPPTTINHFTEPTTQDPTTLKPTTLEPTTLDPTTFDPTTLDPTTLEHTTQDPTTQDPTTLNPTTPDPTTQDPTTLKPTTLEPTTLDPTTFDPTTLHPTTLDPTTSTSTSPYDDICRGQINGTRLPYPGDNTKYIICQYPLPLEKQCPQNSEFDIKTKTCQTVGESTTYAPPNCSLYSSGHVMVYEGDCSKYYFCFASDAVALDCSQGWYFNPSLKQCVPKAYYSCPW